MFRRIILSSLLLSSISYADEQVLSIEPRLPGNFELAYPNESATFPEISEFEVLNFAPMSNEKGERWAVITINNLASGRRTLNHKHLLGLVADGNRIHPQEISQSFLANETLSIVVNFGENKFPLLDVYSRTQT
ncbi:hypothetical protein HR060_16635 [Catenovulum sp. SM1970]|uniref:hypothetical protein n=1 Tax=Marinifaba aquimaris TaxID=2741323 RepID=UPI00157420FF|nr:hypothetical protein [Marinifaba aquimaris]NTS78472.1 hypothetical protein [Marinifaba aquimaris]